MSGYILKNSVVFLYAVCPLLLTNIQLGQQNFNNLKKKKTQTKNKKERRTCEVDEIDKNTKTTWLFKIRKCIN